MKEIPGFDGYFATRTGEIVSMRSGKARVLAKRLSRKGYLRVNLELGGGEKRVVDVHRLILFAYAGHPPSGHVCRHLNGNPVDNRVTNLTWGTPKQNVADSIRHGTAPCLRVGEEHNASKLTEEQVREIECRARAGEVQERIAAEFGITQRHVSDIKLRRTWCHLWAREQRAA